MAGPGQTPPRRAFHLSAGFLTDARVRRILTLAGYRPRLGRPGPGDDVLVWGWSPRARRGEALARATGAHLVRVEDAFLRSLHPGRSGAPPLGLAIDRQGVHFDASRPSDLETLLAGHPLDDPPLLARARAVIGRMRDAHLGKYCATDPALDPPPPGYVLLLDQTRGDASIRAGQASAGSFARALDHARAEHPGAPVVIRSHPETRAGLRPGHFDPRDLPPGVTLDDRPISAWRMFETARAVYAVTSQGGFEAILAGHRPVLFGLPFYAGWGLSDDRLPIPDRRGRPLSREQLAAAALILYPRWHDPHTDRAAEVEDVLGALEAQARAWREDRAGYVALGMRGWKRGPLRAAFGRHGRLDFATDPARAAADGRPVLVWAGRETEAIRTACAGRTLLRVEDGFLRSRGLGAELVPPLSMVRDDLGIHYDPGRESRLERLVAAAADLPEDRLERARALIATLRRTGVTKYNLEGRAVPDLPGDRRVVLVPGQVEDDASIRLGADAVRTNADLLRAARDRHPQAVLIYKPHPDVEAGLRPGRLPDDARALADHIASGTGADDLLRIADRVVTITSAMGFEALIRGVAVTTLGTPFYAGWGLTEDLGPVPARRRARPCLAALVKAALIDYPRYLDPVTGLPCPVEVAVARLASGRGTPRGPGLRMLAKLQGWTAGQSWLWRQ